MAAAFTAASLKCSVAVSTALSVTVSAPPLSGGGETHGDGSAEDAVRHRRIASAVGRFSGNASKQASIVQRTTHDKLLKIPVVLACGI